MLKSIRLGALVAFVVFGVVVSGFAQDQPAMATVLTVEVEPGANAAFEEFILAFRAGAERTGSSLHWLASQNEVGDGNTYTFTRQFGNWAEFENPANGFMVEAYDEAERARIVGLYNDSVESVSSSAYIARPDLSRGGGPVIPEPAAVIYLDIKVHQGMGPRFEAVVRKVVEATATAAPDLYWITLATSFGVAGTYRFVTVVDEWEDLNTPPKPVPQRLIEHFGAAEGSRLAQEAASVIESINQKLRRVRRDLARPPAGN